MEQIKIRKIYVVGRQLVEDQGFLSLVKSYEHEVITTMDVAEILTTTEKANVLVILLDFDDDAFRQLQPLHQSILGSTAVRYLHLNKSPLEMVLKPIHNYSMKNVVVCTAGFASKEEADRLLNLLRYMGAASRKELKPKVTHLVAVKAVGSKYKKATITGLPIMSISWITHSWEQRFNVNYCALDSAIISEHKLKPFSGLSLCFLNFSDLDAEEMKELTIQNGGEVVPVTDSKCSHVVIDAIHGEENPIDIAQKKNLYVVYKEWFWASLEMAVRADESTNDHAYPIAGTKNYNRASLDSRTTNRRSSIDLLSPNVDFSRSFENSLIDSQARLEKITSPPIEPFSKRHALCLELLQTERNYVEVLDTITNVFKKPLEEPTYNEYLLDVTEIRLIFGNLIPIHEIHQQILQDIQNLVDSWKETSSVGSVYVKHSNALLKAYPPFVNGFENSKETILECDTKYPRFHAFLKKCQSKPECKRESLTELMIRPIQRLPSVQLLLSALLDKTDKNNPDSRMLSLAIEQIREVLNHINEDKRKTEGQIAMFDIINDIEDCPAVLLSANRNFICKIDAKLMRKSEDRVFVWKDYTLTLFLFTDALEICKKRSLKRSHSLTNKPKKNNVTHGVGSTSRHSRKSYRHIELLSLASVKSIYDFSKKEGFETAFVLVTNMSLNYLRTFHSYPFSAEDKLMSSTAFIEKLGFQVFNQENCVHVGNESIFQATDFDHAEDLAHALCKSNSSLVKAKEKISRAFSARRPPLASAISTSSLYTPSPNSSLVKAKEKISRAFSARRPPLASAISTSSLYTPP